MAYFHEHRADTWSQAKEFVQDLGAGWIYRGQCGHGLSSSLERLADAPHKPTAEVELFLEFRRKALAHLQPQFVPREGNTLGWLGLMQHYGAPTRLLDWTHSPYVAFFFAVENATELPAEAEVWAVNLGWMQQRMTALELTHGGNETDIVLRQDALVRRYFISNPFQGVLAVEPWLYDARQSAQQAMFLCPADVMSSFADNLRALQPLQDERSVLRVRLNPALRTTALQDLRNMNVTAATLFPGLDGFGRSLRTMRFRVQHP
jgi:hypothetical protein